MRKRAPIALFLYNRPMHTQLTLEALANNSLASESKLFIFCDGPKKNTTPEVLASILEVRRIVEEFNWPGEMEVRCQDENMGLGNSIISGVSSVLEDHDAVIVFEDDIVSSPGTLSYFNTALTHYQEELRVAGISAYSFASGQVKDNTYFLPIGSSWGWATWSRVWKHFEYDASKLKSSIDRSGRKNNFNFGNYPYWELLDRVANVQNDSWAIRFYASFFLKNMLFLFPSHSLVQNIGFDGSGVNCKEGSSPFIEIDSELFQVSKMRKIPISLTPSVLNVVEKEFRHHYQDVPPNIHQNLNIAKGFLKYGKRIFRLVQSTIFQKL